MPNLDAILATLDAVDTHCGISSAVSLGGTTYQADRTVFAEKLLPKRIKGYVFSLVISGTVSPRPKIGDKLTWGGFNLVIREIDEADTETRIHCGKSTVEVDAEPSVSVSVEA